jgi:ATP-dependent phosphofructokinase / diphosphate-dependent phosphofructokinase
MSSPRIGVLTGGGDCPGLNAVIRAVTKSLILREKAQVFGFEDGFLGLIEQRVRELSFRDVSGILTQGGTILGASNKANPFSFYKEDGRDVSDEAVRFVRDLGLDGIVAIGGDGTMAISHGMQQKGLPMIGVPKTIDNDIVGTSRTFGFDSAVAIATEAIDRLHTTAQSHHRVMILETMGRYAGWIALYAGVASGTDIILIPEVDYDPEEVIAVCQARQRRGQRFTIIAIAEGAKPAGGEMAVQKIVEESPDPIRLGGAGNLLAERIQPHVENEVRTTVLGHVQRGGTPTAFDRNLATAFGAYAAAMFEDGAFGRMVALQENRLTSIALSEVADRTRTVDLESPMVAAARAVGTSFGVPELEAAFSGAAATGPLA